ncbi:MAG: TatD family hydrolase [Nanoarchaeota archaeon]
MFIDVHCHLDMLENQEQALNNMRKSKVICITQGTNTLSNKKALKLSEENKEVKSALGIYPIEALKMSDKEINLELEFIKKNKEKIVAIGEVGLDFKEDLEQHSKQEELFKKFIKLSKELDIPIIIHSRKAELKCIEILEELKATKVIMHCFSGKIHLAKRITDNNWFLTIPTSVKNSEHFQNIIKQTPLEKLFCETDSPYLHPDKQWPNEPSNVIESYKKIAEIKKLDLKEVEKQLEENYNLLLQ